MENGTEITTIKLGKETKKRMDKLRSYPKESYDSLVKRVLDILSICRINPEKARENLIALDRQKRKLSRDFLRV